MQKGNVCMSVSFNVERPAVDGKVIVSEKTVKKDNTAEKFYLVDEDKADKFIKQKKFLNTMNKTQRVMSGGLSVALGVLAGLYMPYGKNIGKVAAGIGTVVAAFFSLKFIDKVFDKYANKNNMKKFNASEIGKFDKIQ